MISSDAALLIIGHGSTVNPDSSAPTLAHAAEIRCRNLFSEVACAFWKEEPSMRDALSMFAGASEVYVVPNFISEGYFTQTVIPRELELNGRLTKRANGQLWKYCEPVGNHPMVTEVLLQRAAEIAPGIDPRDTTLIIVAHGTELNDNSAVAAKREVEKIRDLKKYGAVLNAYMEEEPRIADWKELTKSANVVVVPFFISDGLHSYEDIPILLGIGKQPVTSRNDGFPAVKLKDDGRPDRQSLEAHGEIFKHNPYQIDGRALYYAPSIGTDPRFADIILAQTEIFNEVT